jgi:hypothetical protein
LSSSIEQHVQVEGDASYAGWLGNVRHDGQYWRIEKMDEAWFSMPINRTIEALKFQFWYDAVSLLYLLFDRVLDWKGVLADSLIYREVVR